MKTTLLLTLISLVSLPAWANRMDEWRTKTAEGQTLAVRMDTAVRGNAQVLKSGEKIDCTQNAKVTVLKLTYHDGSQDSVVLVGKDIYNWINRKLTVAHIENGIVKTSIHQILFSANQGGWRWEKEPEKAHLGAKYDRFANVAELEFSESNLQQVAHCPSPSAPTLREDEVVVGDGGIDAAGGVR